MYLSKNMGRGLGLRYMDLFNQDLRAKNVGKCLIILNQSVLKHLKLNTFQTWTFSNLKRGKILPMSGLVSYRVEIS